jgi:glycosyltransferase involved in cell wall biosynthesis
MLSPAYSNTPGESRSEVAESSAVEMRKSGRQLRICTVAYAFHESDSRIMRYTHALAERGDQVDVLSLREDERPKEFVSEGVRVIGIQSRKVNERSKAIYLFRTVLFFLRAMIALSWRHLRARYDVVHVHSMPDFLVFTAWLPKLMGASVILDIHDLLPEFYATKYGVSEESRTFRQLVSLERLSVRFVDHVITANDIWHRKLLNRSARSDKATVMLNYPDLRVFSPQGRDRNDAAFVMLYPGSLQWHQGLDIALTAFAKIKEVVPHAEFHIYGTGPALPSLMALVDTFGLQGRVRFAGMMPLREIARVMEHADLGVVPKRKDSFGDEAFSTKTLEFMAMGLPVLVSDTRVDRYYFDEGVVRFFRGGDADDLAKNMLDLIRDGGARESLRQAGLKFVERNSWNKKKFEYLRLIDDLAGVAAKSRGGDRH